MNIQWLQFLKIFKNYDFSQLRHENYERTLLLLHKTGKFQEYASSKVPLISVLIFCDLWN